jgi:hypothetical protein
MSLARAAMLLGGLWAGGLLAIAAFAAPAAFAALPAAEAGQVVGRLFAREATASLFVAVVLFMIERRRASDAAEAGSGSRLNTNMLLVAGALFCTVAGYYAIQPMMAAARAGQGTWSFGALHAVSTAFYGVKTLLVLALAWRLTGDAGPLRPGPTS